MNEFRTQPRIISLEGNIGAGKSTFLKIVEKTLAIQAIFEPHTKWQQVGGSENLLEKFYAEPQRWAYTFQTYAFVTRVVEQESFARKSLFPVQMLERSVYSDRYCFAKNAFEQKNMNALEWKLYQEWFSWLVDGYAATPAGFIYLRTSPEICYERLKKRNRSEERNVSLDYLSTIHEKHERWLIGREDVLGSEKEVPILVLSVDQDFEHDQQQQDNLVEQIAAFFDINYHLIFDKHERAHARTL
ncbi:MAG: Deoxyadenosine/deoxycytidine kinase [Candidatus Dependentiae bacterium ADurb.Bin331]|nr:MAG: Deoxyadenosine/deoxycytidine kinase [Candidatus Dependentiae bacterium ADurb.Bin331]